MEFELETHTGQLRRE